MKQVIEDVDFETREGVEFVDLTDGVRAAVARAGIAEGMVTVVTRHTTGGIAVNEREPRLQEDMKRWIARMCPPGAGYAHDRDTVDGRANAHAHLAALSLRASETLLVRGGKLDLGTWQAVFFVECDGPRRRAVSLCIRGTP